MRALYRRYRPIKLCEVLGQDQVIKPLEASLKNGKISHAYLLVGPRGCGKTSVARILAHEINGFDYNIEDNYVDIIEIDGASNRGIDNIRELREKAAIAPTLGKYKVYIIDEVHMLTKEAFNALLKTLEEPPEHVVFIMATTDVYKVPVTITSRSQTYTFKLVDSSVMLPYLKQISKTEKIKISDDALEAIARRGGGSFRDTLSLLDQISNLSDKEITKELVTKAMGLPQDESIDKLLNDYLSGDLGQISSGLKELFCSGIKAETLVEEMLNHIISQPCPELMPLLSKLADIRPPFVEAKLLVSLSPEFIPKTIPVVSPKSAIDFNWDSFVDMVKAKNDAIALQLKSVEYKVSGDILNIYPLKKINKTILSRDNNIKVLMETSGGLKVVIHDFGERINAGNDELVSKISDIMGGEVQNDGGGNPF